MSIAEVSERRLMRKRFLGRTRYGAAYRATKRMFVPLVNAGVVDCARCSGPIEPGTPWDLGHDDYHPNLVAGPEHARCNRGAPNRNKTSREW